MIPWWWSWLLTAVGICGLWAAGSRKSWGWLIGLGAQVLWIAYALHSRQFGFLVSALAYGFVYGRNFLAWHRERGPSLSLGRWLSNLARPRCHCCDAKATSLFRDSVGRSIFHCQDHHPVISPDAHWSTWRALL